MNQKTIINEADSLGKNAEDYLQDPSHSPIFNEETGVRSGIYTKITSKNNCIMRRINEPVGLDNVDLDAVYNNHDFLIVWKNL